MTTRFYIRYAALIGLVVYAAAARAESTFSVIEPSGKSIGWKVEKRPASTTQPATTIYSLYDPATQTYHPTTNPADEADLVARTVKMEKQTNEIVANARLTPDQRTHKMIDGILANQPAPQPLSHVMLFINSLRFVLMVVIICMAVFVGVLRVRYLSCNRDQK